MMSEEMRVVVERDTTGPTRISTDALIDEAGDLVLESQDLGKAPNDFFGDSDYEYWTTVKAEDKDRVLLELVADVFGKHLRAHSEFRSWLADRGIPYETFSC